MVADTAVMLPVSFVIETPSLVAPARKPRHLDLRFRGKKNKSPTESRLCPEHDATSSAPTSPTTRRIELLEARVSKLTDRREVAERVIASRREAEEHERAVVRAKLEARAEAAAMNRQRRMERQVRAWGEAVALAKDRARKMGDRRRAETRANRILLEKRLKASQVRRTKLLALPRRALRDLAQGTETQRVDAALVIQHAWRHRCTHLAVANWRKQNLTMAVARALPFPKLMMAVQNKNTIRAAVHVLSVASKMTVDVDRELQQIENATAAAKAAMPAVLPSAFASSAKWRTPAVARIFLTAFMMLSHPEELFPSVEQEEEELMASARDMLYDLDRWMHCDADPQREHELGMVFCHSFEAYHQAFDAWKQLDTRKMAEAMTAHWIELERLWLKVRDETDAETLWRGRIEKDQASIAAKIKAMGPGAIQLFEKLVKTFRDEEMPVPSVVAASATVTPQASPKPKPVAAVIDAEALLQVSSPQLFPAITDSAGHTTDSVIATPSRTTDAASSSSSTASTPSPKASPPPKLAATLPAPPAAAAAAFNNAQLAHEVVLDPDFSLRNARTDADSFEAKVTEIAKRAFFDRVRSELAEGKHAMVPDLLMTMRENLLGMLPNATGATAVEIADKFDRDLMMQQLAEGTKRLDIPAYLHFVAAKMLSMCAPIRDRDIRALEQVDDLALVMQRLLAIQEEMKLDIADYHLQQAKPLLKEHAVEYERSKFDAGVADGSITLSGTRAWLQASWDKAKAIADERNPESVNLEVNKPRFEDVYHDAVLELIFGNVPLSMLDNATLLATVPETLHMDAARLARLQNEVQAALMVAGLSMIIRSAFPGMRDQPDVFKAFKAAIYAQLRAKETDLASLQKLAVETVQGARGYAALSDEQAQVLRASVEKVLDHKDTVYQLLLRRFQSLVRQHLKDGTFKRDGLARVGLDLVAEEAERLSRLICLLVKHDKEVHAAHYDGILRVMQA